MYVKLFKKIRCQVYSVHIDINYTDKASKLKGNCQWGLFLWAIHVMPSC